MNKLEVIIVLGISIITAFVIFLIIGGLNNLFFGEEYAKDFCKDNVSWVNPQWFYCGSNRELLYNLGGFPPFTILSEEERERLQPKKSNRWS